jgi:hypothetical protein
MGEGTGIAPKVGSFDTGEVVVDVEDEFPGAELESACAAEVAPPA